MTTETTITTTRAVTIRQAAPILGLSLPETHSLVTSGKLPALKADRGPYLIAVSDVLKAAAS
jgi:excisionase family DNA binding protein